MQRHKNDGSICRAAVRRLRSSCFGAVRPDIHFLSGAFQASGSSSRKPRMVETRRLELLTLSLQRRCSAS